jgi:hypothetical protein
MGACDPGWSDLDPNVDGCETATSTPSYLSAGPFGTFASASSYGDTNQQTPDGAHRNVAIVGETTPSPADGAVKATSSSHQNYAGLSSISY